MTGQPTSVETKQPTEDTVMICLLCQESVKETELESHVRQEHRIGHQGALTLLLEYIQREGGCTNTEFQILRPPEESEVALDLKIPSTSSTEDTEQSSTSSSPSKWTSEHNTFISAAERVKLGRRKKKGSGEEVRERSRRYSTEVKTMMTNIEIEERLEGRTRRNSNVDKSDKDKGEDDEYKIVEESVSTVFNQEFNILFHNSLEEVNKEVMQIVDAAVLESTEVETSKIIEETIDCAVQEKVNEMVERIEEAIQSVLEGEITNTINATVSSVEETMEKIVEDIVAEVIDNVLEFTLQETVEEAILTQTQTYYEAPKPIEKSSSEDVGNNMKLAPSPIKLVVNERSRESNSDVEYCIKKTSKRDKRSNSDAEKTIKEKSLLSKIKKQNRFSMEETPSESWSCTILTTEVFDPPDDKDNKNVPEIPEVCEVPQVAEVIEISKISKTPGSSSNPPLIDITESSDMVDELLCSPQITKPVLLPTVIDLTTEMSGTESDNLQATQALLEEISLSVFGVRFRCPVCAFVDEQVRGVRDHMVRIHKGNNKAKVKPPIRQEMKVRMKQPRIHKDTIQSAVQYYKAFGGLFFSSGVKVKLKCWGSEIPRIRDVSDKVSETPAKKRKAGPKTWMIKNKLLPPDGQSGSETPSARQLPGRPGLKRRLKPQDFELPQIDESESLAKIGKEILNNDINQVNLFDEIDLDVQNQLLADVECVGIFTNEKARFDENLTGLESVNVDSDFDINDDIDVGWTRKRKSESIKKVKPLKVKAIKKKICLTKSSAKVESVWRTVESDILYNSCEVETSNTNPLVERLRNGEMADDDDSEIENKIPTTSTIKKKGNPLKLEKDESRSRSKSRKLSRLQQLNSSSFNSSRSSSREQSETDSGVTANTASEVESVKSLRLRLSTDTESEVEQAANSKESQRVEKSILSILAGATKVIKTPEDTLSSMNNGDETSGPKKSRTTVETDFGNKEYVSSVNDVNERFLDTDFNQRHATINVSNVMKSQENKSLDIEKEATPEKTEKLHSRFPRLKIVKKLNNGLMESHMIETSESGEVEKETKKLRDFRKSPRKSMVEEMGDSKGRKKITKKPMEIPAEMQLPEGSNRYSRSARGKRRQGEALHQLLSHLLQLLQEKDVNEWFSVPINDKIAPGYSQKVKEPMDFTAMENKLDTKVYGTVEQFKYDFKLICSNCLAYHKPDTCYYKAGRKLQHYGLHILSKRNLKEIVEETPGVFSDLTPFELGFDPLGEFQEDDDLNQSFHDDSSFSESPVRIMDVNDNGMVENGNGPNYVTEIPQNITQGSNMCITAAERVKFGRRRGQNVNQEALPKTGKRKKDVEEIETGVKRMKSVPGFEDLSKFGSRGLDITPIAGEDTIPSSSLFHHDYFGYIRSPSDNVSESGKALKDKRRNLQLQKTGGTYVQCCQESCKKWRLLAEFEDPSLVPEYWECAMNQDKTANRCSTSEKVPAEDEELVNVRFTAGSLVWARVKGYPWWPAMVDYCPDSEEFYWIEEEESKVEPAWYHVVFLEKQVSRSWVRKELVEKMVSVTAPPKNLAVRKNSASQRGRMAHAIKMAEDALTLSLGDRLQKYSFACLYKGKWGEYSDISSDEGGEDNIKEGEKKIKSRRKSRSSVDTPDKKSAQSGLETFECEKCNEKVIYTKYPVKKHLKKHRMNLREYVTKFDPEEKDEKLVVIREWIDTEEFMKAIAEDPWKPNLTEKGSSSDTDRIRTIEEQVSEQSPKAYLNSVEEEEFHVQSAASKREKLTYQRPLLSNDSLIAVSVRNLDPENKNGASFREIVAFISLHFPYYDLHLNTCRHFVKKAYGLKNPEEEEEPSGTFRIRPAVVHRLFADIAPILQKDKTEIEKSMLHPKFLDVMVQRFLDGENFKHPKKKQNLPYDHKHLSLLTFVALKQPASLEQIIIYLLFLFPAFCSQKETFRSNFDVEVRNQPEVETVKYYGETRFTVRKESYLEVVKSLRLKTSNRQIFEGLQASIFDEAFINVLFPGLKVSEYDSLESMPASITSPTSFSSVGRNGTIVATNVVSPVQLPLTTTSPHTKLPIPCDILVYFIAILEERKNNKLTHELIKTQIKIHFDKLLDQDFDFIHEVLKTNIFIKGTDDSYQISPHIKTFGLAVLMKFMIENLDELSRTVTSVESLKSILPRMDEGSVKLQSDFRNQTMDFSNKKCQSWRPPLPESMLLDLAILATADMNDTASVSGTTHWVLENFPWYNLTRATPFTTIPDRVTPGADPDTRLTLTSSEISLAKLQIQRLVLSCRPQLTSIMPRPDLLNCVLEPGAMILAEERRYTRPPFPDGVMVGLSLLHIGDECGWASAFSIMKFVETNFPYYEGEMSTRFLSNISGWLNKKTDDAEFFKVEKEKSGIMPRYQIRPDRMLTCFAWLGKYVTFDKESEAVNMLFMKLPSLLKEILCLPPPDWKYYYRPSLPPTIRATPLSKMLAASPTTMSCRLPTVAPTGSVLPVVSVAPLEAQWVKPPMETHLMIALALILKDCKQFQDHVYDYAPPEDIQVSQFSLQSKNSLQQLLVYMKEIFPYYECKENVRDFVISAIQQNKDMISQFFNLNKNQENKLEYEFKASVIASVYEEVLALADWSQTDAQRLWLRYPKDAETVFGEKPPICESNILALVLFLHGDPSTSYSLCVESIINVMINEVGVASLGLSGQRWGEARLRNFLREIILKLEASGDQFHRDLGQPTLHLALRTEEGRLDELFVNLQKSVFDIISRGRLSENLKLFLEKFMEMATPS